MTQTPRPAMPPAPPSRGTLCPYCGKVSLDARRCDGCRGHFDPLSRQASQNAMGPWFIRDTANPFRPGCSFETLRELIRRGKIVAETIIRGPATRQLWNFAGRTPGVANLIGLCHNCRAPAKPEQTSCASCGAGFPILTDRQHLGLAPIHLLPGQAPPEVIAEASLPVRSPDASAMSAESIVDEDDAPARQSSDRAGPSNGERSMGPAASPPLVSGPPLFPATSPLNAIAVAARIDQAAPRPEQAAPRAAVPSPSGTEARAPQKPPASPAPTNSQVAKEAPASSHGGRGVPHGRVLLILGVVGLAALAVGYRMMMHRPDPPDATLAVPRAAEANRAPAVSSPREAAPELPAPAATEVVITPSSAPMVNQVDAVNEKKTSEPVVAASPPSGPARDTAARPQRAPWIAEVVRLASLGGDTKDGMDAAAAAIPQEQEGAREALGAWLRGRALDQRARVLP